MSAARDMPVVLMYVYCMYIAGFQENEGGGWELKNIEGQICTYVASCTDKIHAVQ